MLLLETDVKYAHTLTVDSAMSVSCYRKQRKVLLKYVARTCLSQTDDRCDDQCVYPSSA